MIRKIQFQILLGIFNIGLIITIGIPIASAATVTFETKVFMPNISEQKEGVPICIDSTTGQLVSGCTNDNTAYICKFYRENDLPPPEDCRLRVVFITSQRFTGALGGVVGADKKCQQAADNAAFPIPGTFRAWLSNTNSSPSTSFTRDGMFVHSFKSSNLGLENVVAYSWAQLTSGSLKNPILYDERGFEIHSDAWTNTLPNGQPINTGGGLENCGSFFFAGSTLKAFVGNTDATSAPYWSMIDRQSCDRQRHLYCFRQ